MELKAWCITHKSWRISFKSAWQSDCIWDSEKLKDQNLPPKSIDPSIYPTQWRCRNLSPVYLQNTQGEVREYSLERSTVHHRASLIPHSNLESPVDRNGCFWSVGETGGPGESPQTDTGRTCKLHIAGDLSGHLAAQWQCYWSSQCVTALSKWWSSLNVHKEWTNSGH